MKSHQAVLFCFNVVPTCLARILRSMPLEFRFALNSQKLTFSEPLTYCQASVRPLCSTAAGACTLHPCEVIAVSLLLKEAWGISMEQLRKPRVRTAFKSIAKKGPSWASLCGGLADSMRNTVRRHPKGQGLTLSTHRVLHIPLHPAILGSARRGWDSGCLASVCCVPTGSKHEIAIW